MDHRSQQGGLISSAAAAAGFEYWADNKKFTTAYFASGFTQGCPYQLKPNHDYGMQAVAPAAEAVGAMWAIGVPQGTTTATAGYYPVQLVGEAEMLVDGTSDVAEDAFLKVAAAATNAVLDHATVPTAAAFARAVDARADNTVGLITVKLLGRKPTVS